MAVTAGVTPGEREGCLGAGMDDCLVKPVRLQDLKRVVYRWLPGDGRADEGNAPEAAAAAEDWPVPDFVDPVRKGEFLTVFGEEDSLLFSVIQAFLGDMPAKLELLKSAIERGDARTACLQAHGMKSSGNFLGLARFGELCLRLEDLAGVGLMEGAGNLYRRL